MHPVQLLRKDARSATLARPCFTRYAAQVLRVREMLKRGLGVHHAGG